MVWMVLTMAGILICALAAIRAHRLLLSALWLAGASALTALMLFLLGAPEVAVIELSVGAGLVTVLFVFAINIAGENAQPLRSLLPKPLAWVLVGAVLVLLGWMTIPNLTAGLSAPVENSFGATLWGERKLDVWLQVVLIFAGVLGVLGLLAENQPGQAGKENQL